MRVKVRRFKASAYAQFKAVSKTRSLYPILDRLKAPRPSFTKEFATRNAQLGRFQEEYAERRRAYFQAYAAGRNRRVEAAQRKAPQKQARQRRWMRLLENLQRCLNPQAFWPRKQLLQWRASVAKKRLRKRLAGIVRLRLATVGLKKDRQRRASLLLRQIESPPTNLAFVRRPEELDTVIAKAIARPTSFDYNPAEMVAIWKKWQRVLSEQPSQLPRVIVQEGLRETRLPGKLFPLGIQSALSREHRALKPILTQVVRNEGVQGEVVRDNVNEAVTKDNVREAGARKRKFIHSRKNGRRIIGKVKAKSQGKAQKAKSQGKAQKAKSRVRSAEALPQ